MLSFIFAVIAISLNRPLNEHVSNILAAIAFVGLIEVLMETVLVYQIVSAVVLRK